MSSSFSVKGRQREILLYREGQEHIYTEDSGVFPDRDLLRLLVRKLHRDPRGAVMFLLEYGGLRYFYLLRYNEHVGDSVENKLIQNITEARRKKEEDGDAVKETRDCLQLFWPFLKADYEAQLQKGIEKAKVEGSSRKALRKIQVKTIDGTVQAREHFEEMWLPESEPVENTFSDLKLFSKDEIVMLEELGDNVFKINLEETEYVLKELPLGFMHYLQGMAFRRELDILQKIPRHPNLVWLVGARDDGEGKIDGLVLRYVHGRVLERVDVATSLQKEKWKKQISDAIHLLHEKDIVWSDAKPGNIIIEDKTDNAVLIDFGGGATRGWVDRDLVGTNKGDMQGLERILEFIENL